MGVYRPKKSRYYWIDFYYKGRRYRESSESPRKRDAELLLAKRKYEIRQSKFEVNPRKEDPKFRKFIPQYMDWAKNFSVDFYISNINSGTANGQSWVLLSQVPAVGDPTSQAIGIRIDQNALKGIIYNAAGSLSVINLATTIPNTTIHLIRIVKNSNNWQWYFDGTLEGSAG